MKIKGTTQTGFEYSVDSRVVKDMRFVEIFARIQKGGDDVIPAIADLLPYLFGDSKDALYAHCADEDGYVDVDRVSAELSDIFKALSGNPETKN